MADYSQALNYVKFVTNLVTCLRLISIYPPKHPLVVNSLKSVFDSVSLVLTDKPEFNLVLSPDNRLIVNGESLSDKSSGVVQDFLPYFKKIEIEDVTFLAGISETEIEQFVRILLLDKEAFKTAGDINKLFLKKVSSISRPSNSPI